MFRGVRQMITTATTRKMKRGRAWSVLFLKLWSRTPVPLHHLPGAREVREGSREIEYTVTMVLCSSYWFFLPCTSCVSLDLSVIFMLHVWIANETYAVHLYSFEDRSAFQRSGSQTLNNVFLGDEDQDNHRNSNKRGRRHHFSPGHFPLTLHHHQTYRIRAHGIRTHQGE